MDSPPPIPSTSRLAPSGSASGSTAAGATAGGLPVSELDSLSATELSQVQTEIATELFGFSPSQFTSRIVDLANDVIYDVVDKVETEVLKRWASEGSATASGETLEERRQRVLKGVNRMETLLMNAVDTRFDQAEVYLLRNTFRVPTELIPYLVLPHHPPDGFPPPPFPALPDSEDKEDDALMKELEQEIASTNKLREEILLLDTVQERLDRRVLALKKIKSGLSEILPNGGARDTLGERSKQAALSVPSYLSECRALLAAAKQNQATSTQASIASTDLSGTQPWKRSRENYLYWRTQRALRPDEGDGSERTNEASSQLVRDLAKTGGQKDLQALKALLEPES